MNVTITAQCVYASGLHTIDIMYCMPAVNKLVFEYATYPVHHDANVLHTYFLQLTRGLLHLLRTSCCRDGMQSGVSIRGCCCQLELLLPTLNGGLLL